LFWDVIIILSSLYFAFLLRFDGNIPSSYLEQFHVSALFFLAVKLPVFYYFRLYHMSWRYVGFYELVSVGKATTLSAILLGAIAFLKPNILFHGFPRSILIIDFLLTLSMVGGLRILKRSYIQVFKRGNDSEPQKRILIVGAGDAGERIVREMKKSPISGYLPVGFVDDDKGKQNVLINGVKVFGKRESIPKLVKKLRVEEVLIAIPSAPTEVIRDMVALARESGVGSIKILPGLHSLLSDEVTLTDIREVQLEDLLGREPVTIDTASIEDYLSGKRVLITGAAGSIGSELVRQVARFQPAEIVLFEIDETELFYLVREIEKGFDGFDTPSALNPAPQGYSTQEATQPKYFKNIHPIVGDVRDASKVERVFSDFSPQIVFHAAAYKHVPMMESHPDEAVKVNVIGTKIVAEAAMKQGVEKFVLISTDKAVKPTSVMGATKRVAEYIIRSLNVKGKTARSIGATQHGQPHRRSGTLFLAVRFGNVLGSRGSVVPIFQEQIEHGGPVTVTHPEMQRYFMTIPEAAILVLQAGAIGSGGEIFVLDMGEPVKILDMAKTLIQLSGLEPDKDIPIAFTGIRPGEKLFEEILTAEEGTLATKHAKIFVAKMSESIDGDVLDEKITRLAEISANGDGKKIIEALMEMVPTYSPNRVNILSDNSPIKPDAAKETAYGERPQE